MKNAYYSQSKIKLWRKCHKAYDYRYRQGLNRRTAPSALARGVTLHEMLDATVQGTDWRVPLEKYRKDFSTMYQDETEGYQTPEELESLYLIYQDKYQDDGL
jgi:hypothetical protein